MKINASCLRFFRRPQAWQDFLLVRNLVLRFEVMTEPRGREAGGHLLVICYLSADMRGRQQKGSTTE